MTSLVGSVNLPKDFRFENKLRQAFVGDSIEKILCYDTCVISINNKSYGKIIISADCIYSHIDGDTKFNQIAYYGDISDIEIINDFPNFIIGPMRKDCVHLRITTKKRYVIPKSKSSSSLCCARFNKIVPPETTIEEASNATATKDNTNENNPLINQITNSSVQIINESVDFYILNPHSFLVSFLKKAHVDFLIRKTLEQQISPAQSLTNTSYSLPNHNYLILLFDSLILQLTNPESKQSTISPEHLSELILAGKRYMKIRSLFWSRQQFYPYAIIQLGKQLNQLKALLIDDISQSAYDIWHLTCLLVEMFGVFMRETDHLYSKYQLLRFNQAIHTKNLVLFLLEVVALINDTDSSSEEVSSLEDTNQAVDLDLIKHRVTVHCVELFYYLFRSSQVNFDSINSDCFNSKQLCYWVELNTTFDSDLGIFNRVNHAICRMCVLWLFPTAYKSTLTGHSIHSPLSSNDITSTETDLSLKPGQLVTIYHYFSSLRSICLIWPKFLKIVRLELREEFFYFSVNNNLSNLMGDYPLSDATASLIASFQKNALSDNDTFND